MSLTEARLRRLLNARQEGLKTLARRSGQVALAAAVVGGATGVGVAVFDRVVVTDLLTTIDRAPWWIVALCPLVGLAVAAVALRVVGPRATPGTADEYLEAYHDAGHDLGWRAFAA